MLGKKALVTGASGFIGIHLCRALIKSGADVNAVSRSRHSQSTGIRWWQADLCDLATTTKIMREVKPDFIFHLASEVTGKRNLEVVLPTFNNNLVTSINLMTIAAEQGCQRFILAGSMEEPEPNSLAIPCSPYAASKCAVSSYARMFKELYKLPIVLAKLFMVYGPEQRDVTKLIPYTILSLTKNDPPEFSSGLRPVDWIYVEDVVEGFLRCALTEEVVDCPLEFGSGNLVKIREVVDEIVRLMQTTVQPLFGVLPDRAFEQVRVANIHETFMKTGWKPRVSLQEGLEKTIAWYTQCNKKIE